MQCKLIYYPPVTRICEVVKNATGRINRYFTPLNERKILVIEIEIGRYFAGPLSDNVRKTTGSGDR